MQRIKKGDEVVVISGRDKGKRGTVLRRVDAQHVVVEGVNRVKKHQRPNPMKGEQGGIIDKDMPISVSSVAIVCPRCGPTRIGARMDDEGKRVRDHDGGAARMCRKCGADL